MMEKQQELKELQEELAHLLKVFQLSKAALKTKEQRGNLKSLEDRLEYRLKELNIEFGIREADIKIDLLKDAIELCKS